MSYIIISKGGGGCVGAVGCIYPWLSIIYRRRHPGWWNILNISQISTTSLSLPLQVQPRVLLRYHHWRQARWTCRHDIAGRCRAQDGRELSCSLHWSVNPTILGEFRMLLLLLVLSSRSNHIIIQSSSHTLSTYVCLFLLLFLFLSSCSQARRDLDLPDHPSTVSSPVSCARGKRRYLLV